MLKNFGATFGYAFGLTFGLVSGMIAASELSTAIKNFKAKKEEEAEEKDVTASRHDFVV